MAIFTKSKEAPALLTETNSVSNEYQAFSERLEEKLNSVKMKERKLAEQAKAHEQDIEKLNEELSKLNNQQILETDENNIKELEKQRKEIRLTIEDKRDLINTDPKPFLLEEINSLSELFEQASTEHRQFMALANDEEEEIKKQIKELEKKRRFLNIAMNSGHKFSRLRETYLKMKRGYETSKA